MMMPDSINTFLSLPVWLITLIVLAVCGLVALLTHRVLVPRIAGPDGARLGAFEAEVVALIGLAVLLMLAMGLLHARHRRGRAVALTLVAVAIGVCFIILFAHGRPFVGENALQPTELRALAARLAAH